jgi:hypothetical protein
VEQAGPWDRPAVQHVEAHVGIKIVYDTNEEGHTLCG